MRRTSLAVASLLLMILHSPLARADAGLPPPLAFAKNFLQLSDDQTRALVTMIQARDAALQPIAAKIQTGQEALARELDSPAPDASTVGRLLLDIRAEEHQAESVARDSAAVFENTLTTEQRDRLQFLRQAARVEPAFYAFKALGLI